LYETNYTLDILHYCYVLSAKFLSQLRVGTITGLDYSTKLQNTPRSFHLVYSYSLNKSDIHI